MIGQMIAVGGWLERWLLAAVVVVTVLAVGVAAALLGASTVVSVVAAGPILTLLAGAGVSGGHVLVQLVLVVGLPLAAGLLGIYGVLVIAWGTLVATWSRRQAPPT